MNDQTAENAPANSAPSVKWGNQTIALSDIPESSVATLVQRTMNHVYGNEMASYAAALKKKVDELGAAAYTEAQIESMVADRREEKLDAILSGNLGVRSAGAPRATAFEALLRSIATERLTAKLAKAKLKLPRGAGKNKDGSERPAGVIVLKTANGPKEFTREDLITNELTKYADEIRAEATRRQEEAELAAEGVDVEDIV